MAAKKRSKKRKTKLNPAVEAICFILIAVALFFIAKYGDTTDISQSLNSGADVSGYDFIIDFIDVGQGDCELLRCNSTAILIDGGEKEYGSTVLNYLKKCGVEKLDCYILTHPHSDHIGASAQIIRGIKTETVISTAFSDDNIPATSTYERTLDAISEAAGKYVETEAGEKFSFGDIKLEILAPITESEDYNDMSVCCRVSCKGTTALLCGDASDTVEKQILDKGYKLSADILKISHHGSRSASSVEFLKAVDPKLGVICCGYGNSYGHPHSETLKTLKSLGIDYLRTDKQGNISVFCNGDKIEIRTEK